MFYKYYEGNATLTHPNDIKSWIKDYLYPSDPLNLLNCFSSEKLANPTFFYQLSSTDCSRFITLVDICIVTNKCCKIGQINYKQSNCVWYVKCFSAIICNANYAK